MVSNLCVLVLFLLLVLAKHEVLAMTVPWIVGATERG